MEPGLRLWPVPGTSSTSSASLSVCDHDSLFIEGLLRTVSVAAPCASHTRNNIRVHGKPVRTGIVGEIASLSLWFHASVPFHIKHDYESSHSFFALPPLPKYKSSLIPTPVLPSTCQEELSPPAMALPPTPPGMSGPVFSLCVSFSALRFPCRCLSDNHLHFTDPLRCIRWHSLWIRYRCHLRYPNHANLVV